MRNQTYSLENLTYTIQENYKNSWLKFILQFTALGKLLNQNHGPSNVEFLQCFLSSWSLMQWVFTRFLQDNIQKNTFNEIVQQTRVIKSDDAVEQVVIPISQTIDFRPGAGVISYFQESSTAATIEEQEIISKTNPMPLVSGAYFSRYKFFPENSSTFITENTSPLNQLD